MKPAKRPPPPSCGFWSELAARSCLFPPDRASFGSLPQTGTKKITFYPMWRKGNKNLQESPFLCQQLGPESGERRCVFPQNSFSNLNHWKGFSLSLFMIILSPSSIFIFSQHHLSHFLFLSLSYSVSHSSSLLQLLLQCLLSLLTSGPDHLGNCNFKNVFINALHHASVTSKDEEASVFAR